MTVRSGFFNDVNDDRVYDAADFADYFASFIGNGVFPNPSTGLQVFENGNMTTVVKAGKGWINGYYVHNDSDFIFQHDIADGLLKRIDRIVLQYSTADRNIDIILKKGAFASTPVAPAVIRDADFYELVLADVAIGAGTTQITQGNITDQRLNNSLCGIVHGVVNQVDTTTIFNQYQQWFEDYSVTKAQEFLQWQTDVTTALENWIDAQEQGFEAWRQAEEQLYYTWLNGKKNDFDTWFATIKDKLSEDAAGNLFNLIDEHKDAAMPHKYLDTSDNQQYLWGLKRNPDLDTPAFVYQGITDPLKKGDINLSSYEQVAAVLEMLGRVDQGTGYISDLSGKRYAARMTRGYVFDGILVDIIYNKPPTGSSVLWKYDKDTDAIFWCNGTVMGKLTINPVTKKFVTFQTIEVTDGITFPNSSRAYLDSRIQFDDGHVYFMRSINSNPNQVQTTHRDIIKVDKRVFQSYEKFSLTSYIEPTIPWYYGMGGFLVTDKHIIVTADGNVNNSSYSVNFFVFDKVTGNGLFKYLNQNTIGGTMSAAIGPYKHGDDIFFLIGDGANMRLTKYQYNPVTGAMAQLGYTASTMPLGPNGITYYYFFSDGNDIWIGDRLTCVDATTLTIKVPTVTPVATPVCKIGNEIYVHSTTSLQVFDVVTKTFTTIAALGTAVNYRIGGWMDFVQTEPFDINKWLYAVNTKGPTFIENKYDLLYYQGVGE